MGLKMQRSKWVVEIAMLWLFGMLVGHASAISLNVSSSQISILARNIAVLPASLNFSKPVPSYFQVRWRFIPGNQLVLVLKADHCLSESISQHWRDSCVISIQKTDGYQHRTELSSKDVSLVLQDVNVEDSGIYCITFLALDVVLTANIELIVSEGNGDTTTNQSEISFKSPDPVSPKLSVDASASLLKAARKEGDALIYIIRLSFGGLVLCLLLVIIAEHISFTYCKGKQERGSHETESHLHQVEEGSHFSTRPSNSYQFVETPVTDDLDRVYYNSGY